MKTRRTKSRRVMLTSGGRGWTEPVKEASEVHSDVTPVSFFQPPLRRGYSLLELIVAMSLLTIVMTATSSILRTSRQVWEAHEADLKRLQTAHALVRHIVREAREAQEVVAIDANQPNGARMTVRLTDGDQLTWRHDGTTKQVLFQQASVSEGLEVIAEQVDSLEFRPILIDGTAYEPNRIDRVQEVSVLAGVTLPRETPVTRRAVAAVWLRAFGRNRKQ